MLLSLLSIKDFEKVSFILEMKIYKDRSKRLLEFSQSNIHRMFMSRICSIMYTKYEIGYGVPIRVVSGYLQDLDENHWKVILKYLRYTKDQRLSYGESDLKLIEYDYSF